MFSPLRYIRQFDHLLIFLLVATEVARMCGIFLIFSDKANAVIIVIQLAIVAYFCIFEALRANLWPIALSGAFFAIMAFQCWQYERVSGIEANYYALLRYIGFLFYIPFRYARCSINRTLWYAYGIVLAYACIYVVFNEQLIAAGKEAEIGLLTLKSDATRDDRAVLANGLVALGIFLALATFRRFFWLSVPALAVFGYAIFLAQSRMYTAILLAVTIVMLVCAALPFIRRFVALGASAVLVTLFTYSISGFFVFGINPYSVLFSDISGMARYLQYRAAVSYFEPDRLLTGMGIASSTEESQMFVKSLAPFFASDLGSAGTYFTFGIIGWLLQIVLSLAMLLAIPERGRSYPTQMGLYYGVFAASIMGFFSTSIFGGDGTILAMLTLATIARGEGMRFLPRVTGPGRRRPPVDAAAAATERPA